MGRPRKYDDPYGGQKAYFQTPKGKAALKRTQSSENGKRVKREWWQKNRGKTPGGRAEYFIDTYGDPEVALTLLTSKEQEVVTLYYGLGEKEQISVNEIGRNWEKSHQWISQIKKSAENKLAHLKKAIEEDIDPEK